ncbi:MAG: hypothetical protein DMF26_15670 [Verrucomicrobia bacterium]|nr:MAG: hypothetical protein DMF26_15670 [Verrucomicrobiota bacterium]
MVAESNPLRSRRLSVISLGRASGLQGDIDHLIIGARAFHQFIDADQNLLARTFFGNPSPRFCQFYRILPLPRILRRGSKIRRESPTR